MLYTTERLSGTIGSQTSVREKTFEGFKVLPFSQGVITADGNTVVKINYSRKDITITLDLNGGYFESDNIPQTFSGKYGADTNIPTPVRNDNYTFDCWNCNGKNYANLSTFPAVSGTYTARWTEQEEPPLEIGFDVEQPDNNEYAHISQEQTENTVIFKADSSNYDSYIWYIDGEKQNETSDTFTVDTSKMKAGLYTVMVKVKYNGKYYSDTTTFSVKKQAGGK